MDLVIEGTGVFVNSEGAGKHLTAGAKKVSPALVCTVIPSDTVLLTVHIMEHWSSGLACPSTVVYWCYGVYM